MVTRTTYGKEIAKYCTQCNTELEESEITIWHYKGKVLVGMFCSFECDNKYAERKR